MNQESGKHQHGFGKHRRTKAYYGSRILLVYQGNLGVAG
jgi:hypothetical protein